MKSERSSIWQKIENFMFFFFMPRLFIVIGATLSIEGCLNYQAAANFWNNAIETTGTIVSTRIGTTTSTHTSAPDGSSYTTTGSYTTTHSYFISTILFKTLQREIMTLESDPDMCVDRPSSRPCEGRKVEILYDSSNPHQAIVKGSASPLVRVITRVGVGMFFVIIGVIGIKNDRDFENFNRSFGRNSHR